MGKFDQSCQDPLVKMKLIYTGSESQIFLHENLIYKYRQAKSYRLPQLDKQIREKRTKKEIKILKKINDAAIGVPQLFMNDDRAFKKFQDKKIQTEQDNEIFDTNIDKTTIIMSYIQGQTLNTVLLEGKCNKDDLIQLGNIIAKIHRLGIIHGDITPSNIILFDSRIYIIDFGLSFHSDRMEDRAVDIWMFEKIMRSLYAQCEVETRNDLFKYFLDGYLQSLDNNDHDPFLSKLADVRERGRKIGC